MSFNFENFLSAMAALIKPVGEAVILLHPGAANEALKIQVGTALITSLAQTMHQVHVDTAATTAAPEPAPAPVPVPAPVPAAQPAGVVSFSPVVPPASAA